MFVHSSSKAFVGLVQVTCDVYRMCVHQPIPLCTVDGATYSTVVEYPTSTSDTGWSHSPLLQLCCLLTHLLTHLELTVDCFIHMLSRGISYMLSHTSNTHAHAHECTHTLGTHTRIYTCACIHKSTHTHTAHTAATNAHITITIHIVTVNHKTANDMVSPAPKQAHC